MVKIDIKKTMKEEELLELGEMKFPPHKRKYDKKTKTTTFFFSCKVEDKINWSNSEKPNEMEGLVGKMTLKELPDLEFLAKQQLYVVDKTKNVVAILGEALPDIQINRFKNKQFLEVKVTTLKDEGEQILHQLAKYIS